MFLDPEDDATTTMPNEDEKDMNTDGGSMPAEGAASEEDMAA